MLKKKEKKKGIQINFLEAEVRLPADKRLCSQVKCIVYALEKNLRRQSYSTVESCSILNNICPLSYLYSQNSKERNEKIF